MMKLKINTQKKYNVNHFISSRPFYNVSIFGVRLLRCNLFLRKSNINGKLWFSKVANSESTGIINLIVVNVDVCGVPICA